MTRPCSVEPPCQRVDPPQGWVLFCQCSWLISIRRVYRYHPMRYHVPSAVPRSVFRPPFAELPPLRRRFPRSNRFWPPQDRVYSFVKLVLVLSCLGHSGVALCRLSVICTGGVRIAPPCRTHQALWLLDFLDGLWQIYYVHADEANFLQRRNSWVYKWRLNQIILTISSKKFEVLTGNVSRHCCFFHLDILQRFQQYESSFYIS